MIFLFALCGFLAVYNNATNLLGLPDSWYVPLNVALTAALVAGARAQGYEWRTLGLHREALGPGLRWGAGAFALVGVALLAAFVVPAAQPLLADQRVAGLEPAGLAFQVFVRIPFGTVLWEEVAFRGVLFGVWAHHVGRTAAVLGSSAVFGLWHVGPMIVLLRENDVALDAAGWLAVAGGVGATAAAGVVFCLLRVRTAGVVAPMLAHLATNSLGTVAAFVAQATGVAD
jgi:uncharacterized protein